MATYDASELEVRVKFTAGLETDKDAPKIEYNNVTVVFEGVKDAVTCGSRFVTWTLQRLAREGKLPSDREIRVNSKGEFEKVLTFEEVKDTVSKLSEDEEDRLLNDLIEKKKAKLAAEKAAKKA